MNTANNQVYQETEKRLREALLAFMDAEQEPTVGQLCERAQINRSTFYRHYADVFDLMEKTENELQQGLVRILETGSEAETGFLERMITYIGAHQGFYRIYLRKHADTSFEAGFQTLWESRLMARFQAVGVTDERRMLYYYEFIRAGTSQVLKLWIDGGCLESPGEIGKIIKAMLVSSYQKG